MKIVSSCLSLLAGVLFSRHACVVVAQQPVNVSIVHVNDHHSFMDDVTIDIPRAAIPAGVAGTGAIRIRIGSFPRLVALIKSLSASANASGFEPIRLHAGDAITGTSYFTYFGSLVDATVLNLAGFDAMTIGNHEFDRGDTFLAGFINNLTFPVLSANVVPNVSSRLINSTGSNIFRPFIIKTLANGQRVGICGITTKTKTELSSFPDPGTRLRVETEAATACVGNLTALSINKIVLLTHIGYANDLAQMATIPNVDVVVGGDSHSLLGSSTAFNGTGIVPLGPYATLVNNNVCVVQAWEYSKVVGRLDIQFDANGVVTSCSGSPYIPFDGNGTFQILGVNGTVFLNPADTATLSASLTARGVFTNTTPDPIVAAALAPFRSSLRAQGERVAGVANVSLCHTRNQQPDPLCIDRNLSSCLGGGAVCNLVSQGFLFNVPNADFAIQNNGGCRTNIDSGNITYNELFTVLPFANTLVTLRMTGRQIKGVLEDAANFFLNATLGGGTGSYPFAAGLRWRVDYRLGYPNRFSNIEMNIRLRGNWTPLVLDNTYTVVTNSFTAAGRDGYFTFLEVQNTAVDTFIEYGQSFINYVESIKRPINEPPLSEFSSQRMNFLDGRQCDAITGITFPDAPSARPSSRPSARPSFRPSSKPVKKPVMAPVKPPVTPEGECPSSDACRSSSFIVSRRFFGFCISRCVRSPRRFLALGWACGRGC